MLEGIAIGAAIMYFYDPDRGRSRRCTLKDQTNAQVKKKRQALDVMTRDLQNRAQGVQHIAKARFNHEPVSDDVLIERIRAELGRHVTHTSSIVVTADNGHVTVSGPVLVNEVQDLVRVIRWTPGVKSVDNNLDVHESNEGVPGLQGHGHLPQKSARWSPATSLLALGAGTLLSLYGTTRRGLTGMLTTFLGSGMVAKAFWDTEHRFDPINGHQTSVDQKSQGSHREVEDEEASAPVMQSAEVL